MSHLWTFHHSPSYCTQCLCIVARASCPPLCVCECVCPVSPSASECVRRRKGSLSLNKALPLSFGQNKLLGAVFRHRISLSLLFSCFYSPNRPGPATHQPQLTSLFSLLHLTPRPLPPGSPPTEGHMPVQRMNSSTPALRDRAHAAPLDLVVSRDTGTRRARIATALGFSRLLSKTPPHEGYRNGARRPAPWGSRGIVWYGMYA